MNGNGRTAVSEVTCPVEIQPTDRYEMYSPKRICGRAVKANGFCGLHNPDRPVNPILVAKTTRKWIGLSLTRLAESLAEATAVIDADLPLCGRPECDGNCAECDPNDLRGFDRRQGD